MINFFRKMFIHKKSQLDIMQNTFAILFMVLILIIFIVFFASLYMGQVSDKQARFHDLDTKRKLNLLKSFPELSCQNSSGQHTYCYDIVKLYVYAESYSAHPYYVPLLGKSEIKIRKYNPSPTIKKWDDNEEWVVYDYQSAYPNENYEEYVLTTLPIILKDPILDSESFGVIEFKVFE